MKKLILIFCSLAIISPVNIHASEIQPNLQNYNIHEPKADRLEWRYKFMNGTYYKRLWNVTKERWETDRWIPV